MNNKSYSNDISDIILKSEDPEKLCRSLIKLFIQRKLSTDEICDYLMVSENFRRHFETVTGIKLPENFKK